MLDQLQRQTIATNIMKLVINIVLVEPLASFLDGIAVFYAENCSHLLVYFSLKRADSIAKDMSQVT